MAKPTFKRLGQKLNIDIRAGLLEKEGDSIAAVYLGTIQGQKVDETTGEVRELNKLVLLDPTVGERYMIFQDAGLKKAMEGTVDVNDFVEIVFMGQRDIGKGRRLNTYDLYQLEKTSEIVTAIAAAKKLASVPTISNGAGVPSHA